MEQVTSIQDALQLLKQNRILISESKIFVFMKEEQIFLRASKWQAQITSQDFKDLFKKESLWIFEKKEEEISSQKDDEYYQWRARYL